jgi:hypothetical protein
MAPPDGAHAASPASPSELGELRRRISRRVAIEILLVAIYVAICMAVFRIFKIPVNEWSLSTAVLIGIFGISLLILAMSYNHPFTANARMYYAVTPIFPTVKGRVIEAAAESNTPLNILFRVKILLRMKSWQNYIFLEEH